MSKLHDLHVIVTCEDKENEKLNDTEATTELISEENEKEGNHMEENKICDVFSTHRCCDCFEPTDRLSHRLISSRENLSTSPQCKISFSLAEKGIEWIDDELRSRHHGTLIFVLENS